jgi:hypothetical protein
LSEKGDEDIISEGVEIQEKIGEVLDEEMESESES